MEEYGIDIGSVSLKIAHFQNGNLKRTDYIPHSGNPYKLLLRIIKELDNPKYIAITGNIPKLLIDNLGVMRINEVESTIRGTLFFHPEVKSIIEIGGTNSKYIQIDRGLKDFSANTLCAAGAGIFLDQQAQRLMIPIEKFGDIALGSKNPARIAGRCSVFAKSDMIHLQQIGTPIEDLIAGLCLALARNFKSAILKGKKIQPPVAFVGGVAANIGVRKAIQEILSITPENLLVPEHYNTIPAIGAVLVARRAGWTREFNGLQNFENWLSQPEILSRLPPLDGRKNWNPIRLCIPPVHKTLAYLGIDIGSISTNLVLIDQKGTVLARRYLWTKGRPIEVVIQGLNELKSEIGDKVEIIGVGTTGSGRYLIGEFVGADLIKNEISAQARAAIEIDPQTDTIFEIGGQDSKYISIKDRTIVDFEMNKVCAAGTGSFLEEQSQILGVKLEEFGDRALLAQSPINLGERCTVFIGTEVIHHQRNLAECENLLAGLGYSTVYNYLNRVVGSKKIGSRILFQGGVAANKAVVSAFEQVLKKKITVPPNFDITGAIGIALLVRDAGIRKTNFRGFDLTQKNYKTESFSCTHCSNNCEINRITIEGEKPIFYGGRCDRYEEKEKQTKNKIPDLFEIYNEIFFKLDNNNCGIPIGIPRSLVFYELFPFFYKFLTSLGFNPILSEPTNRPIIQQGSEISVADTCLPVKVAMGHIQSLTQRGITQFFIPSVITMKPNSPIFTRSFVCPYVQAFPYLVSSIFGEKIAVYSPYLYFDRAPKTLIDSLYNNFAKKFGKKKDEVRYAIQCGFEYQKEIREQIKDIGQKILDEHQGLGFVILSRPYNGYDSGMNLKLSRKIRNLGVLPIPLDFIKLNFQQLIGDFRDMYWHYGQKILAAIEEISNNERLYPVYLSNFACGPDSFLINYFREKLNNKPMLVLELDEHSGDAGFITRLEAFYDSITGKARKTTPKIFKVKSILSKNRIVYIPDMCDGAKILASAMKSAGIDAQVMEPPDTESLILGRQFTSGRECLPAIITAGDMVKQTQKPDFNPRTAAFFMAQGSGPCRFGQYYKLHRMILDKLGLEEVPIYAPNQGPSLFDDLGPMGKKFLVLVWDGICAVDGLEALARKIRPYEIKKGETDKIYSEILSIICRNIEKGKGIINILKEAKENLTRLKTVKTEKLKIGIVGEIYIRSQKFSNNFLIKRLEELGCEVALPSIAEWFFYTNLTRIKNCPYLGQHRRAVFTKLFNKYMEWRQRYIYQLLGLERERPVITLLTFATDFIHPSFEGEAILSVSKTIEFMKEGFCGVVNVMPFTCMPGNIVTTTLKRLKDLHPDFPLLSISFDGIASNIDEVRLETFVHQAIDYKKYKGGML
ncbi:MAG: acyl-CoA dehydratase activase [candidate division WOR-3 bacterium]